MRRDIFLTTFCQILRHAHALDGLFSSSMSFCQQCLKALKKKKNTALPIYDHKYLLSLSSAFMLFSHRNTWVAHISSVTFHLGLYQGGGLCLYELQKCNQMKNDLRSCERN